MGMYDQIKCEYALPVPEDLGELTQEYLQNTTYQSKDLDFYGKYKICKDGYLWRLKVEGYHEQGDPNAKSVFDRIGRFVETQRAWIKIDKTVELHFYEMFYHLDEDGTKIDLKNDYWVEYKALVIRGKVEEISIKEFKKTDNSARKAASAKWENKFKKQFAFVNKWYIKFWYNPWRWMIRNFFRRFRMSIMLMDSLSHKVEKFLAPW